MNDLKISKNLSRRPKVVLWAWILAGVIVLAIVAILALKPIDRASHSKEAVLKIDLRTMRVAIDNYTLDKQKPPKSLQDLVDGNYLRAIPVDPMTHRCDWVVEFGDVQLSPDSVVKGIIDIHSKSIKISINGTRYDSW